MKESQQDLNNYYDLLAQAPTFEVQDAFTKGHQMISHLYKKIMVAVSGGSDSDILMDFVERLPHDPAGVKYIFFDTGMEFQATKEHLDFLEQKYGVTIHRERAVVPVPLGVRKYGQPFISKQVSEYIERLQRHDFKWEDRPFDELYAEYPKCKAALRWWCNNWGEKSRFNISNWRWLKEFMVENPPAFKISPKCCEGAKKKTAKRFEDNCDADLNVQGVRRAEGGARSTAYKSCFSEKFGKADQLRPIFWFSNADKRAYCETFGVTHSRCYTQYGLPGTGCACCPFGSNFENELKAAEQYEPKLHKAALKVFGDSYEYTRAYRKFKEEREAAPQKNRTKALAIPRPVKLEVAARDSVDGWPCCLWCGRPAPSGKLLSFSCAHYISRAQGGLGIPENILTLCPDCHAEYDATDNRQDMREFFKAWLIKKYPDWQEELLVYKK